jgi:hypothetical protein
VNAGNAAFWKAYHCTIYGESEFNECEISWKHKFLRTWQFMAGGGGRKIPDSEYSAWTGASSIASLGCFVAMPYFTRDGYDEEGAKGIHKFTMGWMQ